MISRDSFLFYKIPLMFFIIILALFFVVFPPLPLHAKSLSGANIQITHDGTIAGFVDSGEKK